MAKKRIYYILEVSLGDPAAIFWHISNFKIFDSKSGQLKTSQDITV